MASATNRRLRILAVLPWPDNPVMDGFAQRSHMIVDALNQLGDLQVLITTTRNENSEAAVEKMRQRIHHVNFMPISLGTLSLAHHGLINNSAELLAVLMTRPRGFLARDFMKQQKQKSQLQHDTFDVVFYRSVPEYLYLSRLICTRYQIVDFDERQSEILKVENFNRQKQLQSRLFKYLEQKVANRVDAVCLVKDEDAEDLTSQNTHELRNMPLNRAQKFNRRSDSGAPTIVFAGNFTHSPPNVDCARRILQNIYPKIRAFVPECKLLLAGSGLSSLTPPLHSSLPGVEFRSDVEHISDVYASASLLIYPVEFNPGSSVILPEAICHGVPVVASQQAAKGQPKELIDRGVVIVAQNDDEFTGNAIQLLNNRDKLLQLQKTAVQCASEFYPESYFQTRFTEIISGLTIENQIHFP
ncbi:MAG: glycosyltransferase [Deltaproteobacteria bacterium]|nr:glycosyltransferase [Deltaproteobacteria bacterium]